MESDLPDMKNTELCRSAREEGDDTPILVLLDKDNLDEKLESLDCGADAVLTKLVHASEVDKKS